MFRILARENVSGILYRQLTPCIRDYLSIHPAALGAANHLLRTSAIFGMFNSWRTL